MIFSIRLNSEEVLKRAGYIKIWENSFIKPIGKKTRYHALLWDYDKINIHWDREITTDGHRSHISRQTGPDIKKEITRIKEICLEE